MEAERTCERCGHGESEHDPKGGCEHIIPVEEETFAGDVVRWDEPCRCRPFRPQPTPDEGGEG